MLNYSNKKKVSFIFKHNYNYVKYNLLTSKKYLKFPLRLNVHY